LEPKAQQDLKAYKVLQEQVLQGLRAQLAHRDRRVAKVYREQWVAQDRKDLQASAQ
jgi:hypothetical protein